MEQALHIYDNYLFILREKTRIEAFLNDNNYTREQFAQEIQKFESTIKSIRENMPFEIRMNMFLVDCGELNNKLCQECEELIEKIVDRTAVYTFQERSNRIISDFKSIQDSFSVKAENSAQLVKLEKELEDVKNTKRLNLIRDYNELVEWLMLLYNTRRCQVEEDQTKLVLNAYIST